MRKNIVHLSVLLPVLFFFACSAIPTSITINGDLSQGDSIVVDFFLQSERYCYAGSYSVTKEMEDKSEAYIPISPNITEDILGFNISFFVKNDKVLCIKSIKAGSIAALEGKEILNGLWWQNGVDFKLNTASNTISGHVSKSTPAIFANGIYSFYVKRHHNVVSSTSIFFIIASIMLVFLLFRSTKYKKLLAAAILLYVICLPLKISWSNWVLLALGLAALAIFLKNKERRFGFSPAFGGVLGVIVTYLLGCFYSISFKESWSALSTLLAAVPLTLIFSIISIKKEEIRLILLFFMRYISLYCVYLIFCFTFAIPVLGMNSIADVKEIYPYLFPFPSFTHPSFIAIIIAMAIPVAIYLKAKKEISWLWMVAAILLITTVVILSGARIGLVVVPLLLVLSFLFYTKIRQYLKYAAVGVGCILAFVLYSNPSINEKFSDPLRKDQRATAIAAIKERPFFGWGTESMKKLLRDEGIAQKAGLEKPVGEVDHFHNQYLDMLVQLGVVGALPFFALFAYLIYLAIKKKDVLLMAYLAIYLPFMYVESPFATAKGIQPMIFWLCFLLSTQKIRLQDGLLPTSSNKPDEDEALGSTAS